MQVELQAHIAFHLTGRMLQGEGDALARSDLQPALFAGYRDLTALRYDFPLVLIADAKQPVQSLSGLFDRAAKDIAGKDDGERARKHAGRLEWEIRKLIAEGTTGTSVQAVRPRRRAHRREERRATGQEPESLTRRAQA